MKVFIKLASYLFHPIWMPFIGALIFFEITPRFFPDPVVKAKLLAISILTVFIPIVFYFLLKNLNLVDNMMLKTAQERRLPMLFFCLVILTVINFILPEREYIALFYFFSGILYTSMMGLLLVIFKFKVSLHMMGISGVAVFLACLSITYGINLSYLIAFTLFAIGWTASSRIQQKARKYREHSNTPQKYPSLRCRHPHSRAFWCDYARRFWRRGNQG